MAQIGEIFAARYRVVSVLGEGGFAQVFAAEDVHDGTRVALKVLKYDGANTYKGATRARFQREARLLSRLESRHTVRLFASGESDAGELYMVFEQIPGRDLSEYLALVKRLAPHLVKTILLQLLEALAEAHDLGLIHRDLKPENVRVFETPNEPLTVKLLDFGIARATDSGHPSITRTGELIGTPRYMSPEQILERPLTPASDIYSLGMMTLELVVGREHLPSNRFSDQFDRLVTGHVFSIPEAERVGVELIALIQKMTARDPGERFANAREVLFALQTGAVPKTERPRQPALDTRPAPTNPPPQSPPRPGARPPSTVDVFVPTSPTRSTANKLLAALAAFVAFGAIGFSMLTPKDEPAPVTTVRIPARPVPHSDAPPASTQSPVAAATSEEDAQRVDGCGYEVLDLDRCEGYWCLHIPRDYENSRRHALLVVLHPRYVKATDFLDRFVALSERENVIVMAPVGDPQKPWRNDDGKQLPDYIEFLMQDFCIDPERIFVFASQDGGRAASVLDCSGIPAAVAYHAYLHQSGGTTPFKCEPTEHPIPMMWFAPAESARWPIAGGGTCLSPQDNTLSVANTLEEWAKRNQCRAAALPRSGCADLGCDDYPTRFCVVPGGTDPWGAPDGCRERDEQNFDGVLEDAWEFFESVRPTESP